MAKKEVIGKEVSREVKATVGKQDYKRALSLFLKTIGKAEGPSAWTRFQQLVTSPAQYKKLYRAIEAYPKWRKATNAKGPGIGRFDNFLGSPKEGPRYLEFLKRTAKSEDQLNTKKQKRQPKERQRPIAQEPSMA